MRRRSGMVSRRGPTIAGGVKIARCERRGGIGPDEEGAAAACVWDGEARGAHGHHGPQRQRKDHAAGRAGAAGELRPAGRGGLGQRQRAQPAGLPPVRELRGAGGHAHGRLHRAGDAHVLGALHAAALHGQGGEGAAGGGGAGELRPVASCRRHRGEPVSEGPQRRAEAPPEPRGGAHPQPAGDPAGRADVGLGRHQRHGHRAGAQEVLRPRAHRRAHHPPAVLAALDALRQVHAPHPRPGGLHGQRGRGARPFRGPAAALSAVHQPGGSLHRRRE
eukprot:scaffold495_cov243-Pinguiococcus_pyrenoidosus.AAC.29